MGRSPSAPCHRDRYVLDVNARRFAGRRIGLEVHRTEVSPLRIALGLAPLTSEVTVTADRGATADTARIPPVVTVRDSDEFRNRPLATLGNALEGAAGVMVQQSTYGQTSPFLRGLTGYQVINLVDGVRLNNTTFRSGPNQYLAFVDPSQSERISRCSAQRARNSAATRWAVPSRCSRLTPTFRRRTGCELRAAPTCLRAAPTRRVAPMRRCSCRGGTSPPCSEDHGVDVAPMVAGRPCRGSRLLSGNARRRRRSTRHGPRNRRCLAGAGSSTDEHRFAGHRRSVAHRRSCWRGVFARNCCGEIFSATLVSVVTTGRVLVGVSN